MGLNLDLLPIQYTNDGTWLARDYLWLKRNYNLFAYFGGATNRSDVQQIIFPKPLDRQVWYYGDEGLEKTTEDPYGSPLTYFLAGEIKALPDDVQYASEWNRACIAMIQALPPDTPVILWWH